MQALATRPSRNTGAIEVRDFGPGGRRLGTPADCYDGSPWELHRGELIEQMGSKDVHAIVMTITGALFHVHARDGLTVMTDVYCDLSDEAGPSLRAPDVTIVSDLSAPRNEIYRGTPVLAVEIRGTQSKRYLEEKVKLYLEHDWPTVWIIHAERQELEVRSPGVASITYRAGAMVPMPPALDKHGLDAVALSAFFDEREASRFTDGWVRGRGLMQGMARGLAQGRAEAILGVLAARGLDAPAAVRARVLACGDVTELARWLAVAATAESTEGFVAGMG